MESCPVTPKRVSCVPWNDPPTPASPLSASANPKRTFSHFLEPRELNIWGPQPLTPPYTTTAKDEPDTKRARIAWPRSDTSDVFAQIEKDIDAHTTAEQPVSPSIPRVPHLPSTVDFTESHLVDAAQDDAGLVGSERGQRAAYELPLMPFDEYADCNGNLYGSVKTSEPADEEVCFGMIQIDPFELATNITLPSSLRNISRKYDLHMTKTGTVHEQGNSLVTLGYVKAPMLQVLHELARQPDVTVQLHCIFKHTASRHEKRKVSESTLQLSATLYAIVYGPFCAFDSIGDFLEDCDVDLQDPEGCDRNVRYRNPHRISGRDEDVPMTIERDTAITKSKIESITASPDCLDSLAMHSGIDLAENPAIIRTKLHPYQQQALFFMLTREQGWSFDGTIADIWLHTNIEGIRMYLNTITDDAQLAAPPQFRGGLLADKMGLGKTISIISLIASDLTPPANMMSNDQIPQVNLSSHYSKCTLVVVPPNLLDTWELQLKQHCHPGNMRWTRHHEKIRLTLLSELTDYHIVLTTYNTVSTEWRTHRDSSILFSTYWHRIVLDEAHYIKGELNQSARAICDLKAYRRWAVTGTPIQNHLNDLEALLRFLRVYPYHEHSKFESDIVKLWKFDSEAAITRLKRLIACITLRRPSNAIQLPPKNELLHTLPFSLEEQEVYKPLEIKISHMLNQTGVCDSNKTASRARALKGLHLLRAMCNHGTLTDTRKFLSDRHDTAAWSRSDAQLTFESLSMSDVILCARCTNDVIGAETSGDTLHANSLLTTDMDPIMSQCEKVLCGTCIFSLQQEVEFIGDWCGHIGCATFPVSTSKTSMTLSSSVAFQDIDCDKLPTKIKALVKDICLYPTSKSIVFSCWRTTLDLVAIGLKSANIKFVRFDGDVKPNKRTMALHGLENDQTVQVLLITTSCGAVGLDLTAANRAYIMEPQWNPTIEEQALSRIHRQGQQLPVTIIRFVMAESIEQRVMEVNSNKKSFAELLFASKKQGGGSGHGRHSFEVCQKLLIRR